MAFLLMIISQGGALADIPWVPYFDGDTLGTVEGLVSVEFDFSNRFTFNTWGGIAFIYTRVNGSDISSLGFEIAAEPRYYLIGHFRQGLFIGLYLGLGVMKTPEYYRGEKTDSVWVYGLSYGSKLGYKLNLLKRKKWSLLVEPYFSLSRSSYKDKSLSFQTDWLKTFGLRFIFNLHK